MAMWRQNESGLVAPVDPADEPKEPEPLRWALGEEHESMASIYRGEDRIVFHLAVGLTGDDANQRMAAFFLTVLNGPE